MTIGPKTICGRISWRSIINFIWNILISRYSSPLWLEFGIKGRTIYSRTFFKSICLKSLLELSLVFKPKEIVVVYVLSKEAMIVDNGINNSWMRSTQPLNESSKLYITRKELSSQLSDLLTNILNLGRWI